MNILIICFYCGHEQDLQVYSTSLIKDRKCEKCGDKRKKIIEKEKKNVFGYEEEENKNSQVSSSSYDDYDYP